MKNVKNETIEFDIDEINFHPVLKDVENMFYLFLLSIRSLSDLDVQNILRTKDSTQEGYLMFVKMLDKFNHTTNLKIERNGTIAISKMNVLKEMIFMGKAMAIIAYDFLSLSKYNAIINKDIEFQFLRHVRNGAAHNNKFNLKDENGNWKIEEGKSIEWGGMKIDKRLQGTNVFNDFISIFAVFLLAKHFSDKLIEIDNSNGLK
ncbi:MAG: hypothetical protein ACD_7C00039G0009 [uncultured bacterium]|nr:MAG: hypothetical protein ACD_7C00039G0009 [uncultured bacterium]KKP67733.1 MAG: hypothetical protein UR66_C0011G0009 [Candidatus Moranbacteria bacterium GW2011_GWE1_35_17]KKP72433.1 MAG: hypothetical protein UR65_C0015G0003 [Candidatus Moranbacteria bacterium GW2011_GWE2_35_164]KKP81068.1 MAG: hypothetical protein UR82_C0073G0006 [Candidatus Moranbacteria bacterium GW2011_GWF1_35_5]KKP84144.1 MAG: hypothetical protein UR83_C0026G0007 [Candidatus Moranbacteria bacterium GW2011_GWF2_35_54]HB